MNPGIHTRRTTLTTLLSLLALATSWSGRADALELPGLLDTTDTAIPIDLDAVFVPGTGWPNTSPFPGEEAFRTLDQVSSTKYLNLGEERSGLIITNSAGPVQVNWIQLYTANDFFQRDPASYELHGTNNDVSGIAAHSTGVADGVSWQPISSGPLSLPDARFSASDFIFVNSPGAYTSYRLIFPTVKDAVAANAMQIADVQFYTAIPEPASSALLAAAAVAMPLLRARRPKASRHARGRRG